MGHIKSGNRHEVEYLVRQLLDLAPKDAWAVLYGWVKADKIACSVMRTLAGIIIQSEVEWEKLSQQHLTPTPSCDTFLNNKEMP